MVLTVTLNPLLEKKLSFEKLGSNSARAYKQEYLAGGKGINVNRQLNLLGIKNHALIFLGGFNGKRLRHVLEKENINFSAVSTKSETREAFLIFDESTDKLKTYFGTNADISRSEIEEFFKKLEKAIINSSIVVFSGSIPNDECSYIIEKGIELCNQYDKISILDSYGNKLSEQINKQPTIIHNNLNEISSSLTLPTETESQIREILDYFYKNNVKLSFLTSGKDDAYAAKSDFHYKITVPAIEEKDATGSGDAFIAGIIYGLEKSEIFNDFVKFAAALGAANAERRDVCNVNLSDALALTDLVKINEIGKKIKLIDDSPTI
jgi:1-phosphofructokinase family hexose kinase